MSIGCVGKGTDCPLTKEEIAIAKKNIVSYIYSEFGEYGKIFKENEMFSGRHINSKTNCRVYISGNSIDYIHPEHVVFYSKKSLMVEKIYKVQW